MEIVENLQIDYCFKKGERVNDYLSKYKELIIMPVASIPTTKEKNE